MHLFKGFRKGNFDVLFLKNLYKLGILMIKLTFHNLKGFGITRIGSSDDGFGFFIKPSILSIYATNSLFCSSLLSKFPTIGSFIVLTHFNFIA